MAQIQSLTNDRAAAAIRSATLAAAVTDQLSASTTELNDQVGVVLHDHSRKVAAAQARRREAVAASY